MNIKLEGISKSFGATRVVADLNCEFPARTLTALLGPSGCGKTTLLRLLAGLERPSAGAIHFGGLNVTQLAANKRRACMVFQSFGLFPHMRVIDNVAYGLRVARVPRATAHRKALEALESTALTSLADRWPAELSGGQQQRVAIARSLVLEPAILLFDEPLSSLDTQLRKQLRQEIRSLQQRLGLTAVYVTHDHSEALAIADQVIVMRDGRIVQTASPRTIFHQPHDEYVARFLGDCNLAEATLLSVEHGMARVQVGQTLLLLRSGERLPGPVRIAIRPQGLRVVSTIQGGVPAKVLSSVFLGATTEVELATPFGRWCAVTSDIDPPEPGTRVCLEVDPRFAAVVWPTPACTKPYEVSRACAAAEVQWSSVTS